MEQYIQLVHLQLSPLPLIDQGLYLLSLGAPFCGLILTALIVHSLHSTPLKWLVWWLVPMAWSASFGLVLFQQTAKPILLLILFYLFSLVITGIYYLCLFFISLANLKLRPSLGSHHLPTVIYSAK